MKCKKHANSSAQTHKLYKRLKFLTVTRLKAVNFPLNCGTNLKTFNILILDKVNLYSDIIISHVICRHILYTTQYIKKFSFYSKFDDDSTFNKGNT